MFELRSKMKWYLPPESDFIVQPPSPLEFPGPLTPLPLWNFQFPPGGGLDIFWNHTFLVQKKPVALDESKIPCDINVGEQGICPATYVDNPRFFPKLKSSGIN